MPLPEVGSRWRDGESLAEAQVVAVCKETRMVTLSYTRPGAFSLAGRAGDVEHMAVPMLLYFWEEFSLPFWDRLGEDVV